MKWVSGGTKRQCDRALSLLFHRPPCSLSRPMSGRVSQSCPAQPSVPLTAIASLYAETVTMPPACGDAAHAAAAAAWSCPFVTGAVSSGAWSSDASRSSCTPPARRAATSASFFEPGNIQATSLPGVRSHYRFRNSGAKYVRESGVKWMRSGARRQRGRTLAPPASPNLG